MIKNSRANPGIAAVLSFLWNGLGQIYIGIYNIYDAYNTAEKKLKK